MGGQIKVSNEHAELQFTPVNSVRISSHIVSQILDMIRRQELKPGDKLPAEADLGKMFGASRPTIREALSALKALDLVVSHNGIGNFIALPAAPSLDWSKTFRDLESHEAFVDALEARMAIEGQIAHMAAERADAEEIEQIERSVELCRAAATSEAFRAADHDFHLCLARSSHNSVFVRFVEASFDNLSDPYWVALKDAGVSGESAFEQFSHDHEAILKAVSQKDPDTAREIMLAHLCRIKDDFMGWHSPEAKADDK